MIAVSSYRRGEINMLWWVILLEMIVFAALFTIVIFTYYRGDRKYSPTSIHNYPPEIRSIEICSVI